MKKKTENFKFAEIAKDFPHAIVITNRLAEVTWCNPAFFDLCGYTMEEMVGKKPGSVLQGKETNPQTVRALRDAVSQGQAIETEIINYHKKGYPYWVSITINPIRSENNEVSSFIALERETTSKHSRIDALEKQILELYSVLLSIEEKEQSYAFSSSLES